MASQRAWNGFAQQDPGNARIVRKWVEAENHERANATAKADTFLARQELAVKSADATITKSKTAFATCLKCGGAMKAKHRRCKSCNAKNPCYVPKDRVAMKKNLRFKGKGVSPALVKAQAWTWAADTGEVCESRGDALQSIYRSFLSDPDPTTRMAAEQALRDLAA